MNIVPRYMLKNLNSAKWPWAWASEEKEIVYRRTGPCMRPLDKELYADLYAEAGFGGEDGGETDPVDPDPVDPDPVDPGTGGDEGEGEGGGETPPTEDDE